MEVVLYIGSGGSVVGGRWSGSAGLERPTGA